MSSAPDSSGLEEDQKERRLAPLMVLVVDLIDAALLRLLSEDGVAVGDRLASGILTGIGGSGGMSAAVLVCRWEENHDFLLLSSLFRLPNVYSKDNRFDLDVVAEVCESFDAAVPGGIISTSSRALLGRL